MVDLLNNYILELHYTTVPTGMSPMDHVSRQYIITEETLFPGEVFENIQIQPRSGAPVAITAYTDDLEIAIQALYPATTSFNRWELWKQANGESARVWIATGEIGADGTNPNPSSPAGQVVFSFRTLDGKYMKSYFMETSASTQGTQQPPYSGAFLALSNVIKNVQSPSANKYKAFPIANMIVRTSQNEELFNKRYP